MRTAEELLYLEDFDASNLPHLSGKKALITGITGQDGSYLAGLSWRHSVSFPELVRLMVQSDVRELRS